MTPAVSETPSISVTPAVSDTPAVSNTPSVSETPSISVTPSPSPSVICCYQYEITNYYTISKTIFYTDCNGTPSSISAAGNGLQTYINCAVSQSVYHFETECNGGSSNCIAIVQANEPCDGCVPPVTPTATPSISVSLTPTISVTPSVSVSLTPSISISSTPSMTLSPSPSPICCYQYEITNYYTSPVTIYYTNCPDGTPSSVSAPGNGLQTYINCAFEGTITFSGNECNGGSSDCIAVVIANVSPCGGCVPPVTPSISTTPSVSVTPPISETPSVSISSTPSISVTPSISETPSISVTPPISETPSPSITPSNTPIPCYEYVATADQTDIDNSDNGTVYFEYIDCDGITQTLSRGTTTPSDPVCARSTGTVYILVGGNQSAAGGSLWSAPGTQCNPGGGGGGGE